MNETSQPAEKPKKLHRARRVAKNKKFRRGVVIILAAVGIFLLGTWYGINHQKKAQKSALENRSSSAATSNRWTAVGTVTEVSSDKIKVKDSRGQDKEASITKETKIVNRKGEQKSVNDLKKDQKVIVSGEKDGNNLTVTRIRIQE